MKVRGTPIERIPHLGFKQINLWRIYKAVEKLGGYDSVTARRLWKRVYDELGGSPGSTSAATCTRKHYERLILPYERHIKGEEDKPLPPSKPRKPYKRSMDGKVDGKKKRSQLDRDMESELVIQRSETVMHPLSSLWAAPSDKHQPDCSKPNKATIDLCTTTIYACSHTLPAPTADSWPAQMPPGAGGGISPLEKKKRTAQASLNLPLIPREEENKRPSVILCSQSPARASSARASSDGSPLPLSSSSSRSPSPLSVSSEDGSASNQEKPRLDFKQNRPRVKSNSTEDSQSQVSKETAGHKREISSQTGDLTNGQIKNTPWRPVYKGTHFTTPFHSHVSVKSGLDPSTSSFTKVVPKTVQLLRPAPIRLGYKMYPTKLAQPNDSFTCTKKLSGTAPRIYQTEKWDNSRSRLAKGPLSQHSLAHNLPMSCVVSSYDKAGRDARHQLPFHPAYLQNTMRLPHAQLMYRHVPVGPAQPAIFSTVGYPYPFPLPVLSPQPGYTLPNMMPIYHHKL